MIGKEVKGDSGLQSLFIADPLRFRANLSISGLDKLNEASESVAELSVELVEKEKELAVSSVKAEKVLADVTVQAEAAEIAKQEVQKKKDKAQSIFDSISIDKRTAEAKLEAAKPALIEAENALLTIKPADIATVRKLPKPPHLIMRISDCVLLLLGRQIDQVLLMLYLLS